MLALQTTTFGRNSDFQRFRGTFLLDIDVQNSADNYEVVNIKSDDVFFLKDYLEEEKNKTEIIRELEVLLEEKDEWEEEGITLQGESIDYAILFAKNSIESQKLKNPNIEVHPDGEVAFTWRQKGKGIINIAFNDKGIATWAAYLEREQKETLKGRFEVINGISKNVQSIIKQITD